MSAADYQSLHSLEAEAAVTAYDDDDDDLKEFIATFTIDSDDETDPDDSSTSDSTDEEEAATLTSSNYKTLLPLSSSWDASVMYKLMQSEFRILLFVLVAILFLTVIGFVVHANTTSSSTHTWKSFTNDNNSPTSLTTTTTVKPKPVWLDFEIEPYHGPASLPDTINACAAGHGKCYVYICRGSGFGGQIMSFMASLVYARTSNNRTWGILDEISYAKYADSNGTHFMLAYFTPRMAVLSQPEDRALMDVLLQDDDNVDATYEHDSNHHKNSPDAALWIGLHPAHHNAARDYYTIQHNLTADNFYQDLVGTVCPNVQFNKPTWARIQELRTEFDFPDYLTLPETEVVTNETTGVSTTLSVASVGFHIRRTDKVWTGSGDKYLATSYLEKAIELQNRDKRNLTHCFVATDDYQVVWLEFGSALDQLGDRRGALCRHLHFTPLAGHKYARNSNDGALVFLTELSVLKETTYFVGTFTSNVGDLVSVLRACPNMPHDATQHHAQSYGVDSDDWFLY